MDKQEYNERVKELRAEMKLLEEQRREKSNELAAVRQQYGLSVLKKFGYAPGTAISQKEPADVYVEHHGFRSFREGWEKSAPNIEGVISEHLLIDEGLNTITVFVHKYRIKDGQPGASWQPLRTIDMDSGVIVRDNRQHLKNF